MHRRLPFQSVPVRLRSDEGAGLAEYAVLLLLIAVVCVAAVSATGGVISQAYSTARAIFP